MVSRVFRCPAGTVDSSANAACMEAELDEFDREPVVHVLVSAAGRRPPQTTGARSIFDLGMEAAAHAGTAGTIGHIGPSPTPRFVKCERVTGTTRCTGGQYPADRWTQEREDREKQRRARQIPPKPPMAARAISKKFAALVGAKKMKPEARDCEIDDGTSADATEMLLAIGADF